MTDPAPRSPQFPPLATWHGVTAPCGTCGHVHLSLNLPVGGSPVFDSRNGPLVRLRLSPAAILDLYEVLSDALAKGQRPRSALCPVCGFQSANSSGNPQVDGSSSGVGHVE